MSSLYIFVGHPGAGKTTVAHYIQEATGAVHIWADQERQKMFTDPTHSVSESQQLYAYLNKKTDALLRQGKSVVFDTNFNFYKDREHLRNIAKAAGAETKLIWITTDKALAKERATHELHANRNGYEVKMDDERFERIASHLEPPHAGEHPIKLVGTNLTKQQVLSVLGLS